MKRQDILEIILKNPEAIFYNANVEAGKYSEYPTYFQVIGTSHDKSCVRVKEVKVGHSYYMVDEDGNTIRDENGDPVQDTRPETERVRITYTTSMRVMPSRLVVKHDRSAQQMVDDYIAKMETRIKERQESEVRENRFAATREEMANALVCAGVLSDYESVSSGWGYKVHVYFTEEQMTRLTSILKSSLVEVEV